MGPRPRRIWRRVLRVVLVVLGVLVLLIGVGFGLLHTDWAREKVRGVLVEQIGKRLHGTVEVERLEGDLLDAVTLRGVKVRDRAGKDVLSADSLTVDYRILPLLGNHFHADLIEIVGLDATLRRLPDGRLAVADLWVQQPPGGEPWTTTLASIRVLRSAVKLERAPGVWDAFSRIEIDAEVAVETELTRVVLRSLDAEWKGPDLDRPLPLAATAALRIPATGGMELSGIDVTAGHQHVVVPLAHLGKDGARRGAFAADVSADELARLWKGSPILADLQLAGFVDQGPGNGLVRAHVFGGAERGSINLAAQLGADTTTGELGLFWAGVEPAALVAGAPEGVLDGWVAGNVAGLSLDSPRIDRITGRVRGAVSGVLRGVALSNVSLDASMARRRVTAALGARAAFGTAGADLVALLPEDLKRTGAIALERAEVRANLRDAGELETALGHPVSVRGPVVLTASASGRLDDLSATSRITSTRLTQKQLRLAGLRADLDVQHLDVARAPGAAVGKAEVHIDSITNGPTSYGNAHVIATVSDGGHRAAVTFNTSGRGGIGARGQLVARIEPDGARIAFRELRVSTRDLVWAGKGGRLEITDGGKHLVAELALSSAAGKLRVAGDLTRRGNDLRGPVRFAITRVDIGRVLDQFDRTGMTGKIGAAGEIKLPEGPVKIDVDVAKISWKGAPRPVSGRVRIAVDRRKLEGHADLDAGPLGRVKADLTGRTPARLADGDAWKRLGPKAIDSVKATADNVDLARWVHTLGGKSTAGNRLHSGLATLQLEAGPGLETGKLALEVTGGEVAASTELNLPVTLKLQVGLTRTQVTVWSHIIAGDLGKVELDATAAVPANPLAPAGWTRQGLDLVKSISLRVTDLNLARLQPPVGKKGIARRSVELTGMVQAQITAGQGARTLGATVKFADVRMVDKAAPLAGELTVQAQPRATDVVLAIRVPTGTLVDGRVAVGLGADRIRSLDFAALSRQLSATTLTGQLRVPDQPIARIASALQVKPNASGQLRGELTVRGSIGKPIISAKIEAPGFTAEGVRFDQLSASGSYSAGPWKVRADARQSDGGRVVLSASGSPGQRAPLQAHLDAQRVKLGLFTPLWKRPGGTLTFLDGLLSANLDIGGTAAQPIIDGAVRIREGTARIAQFLRPLTAARVDAVFKRSQLHLTVKATSRPGKILLLADADLRRPAATSFTANLTATKLPVQAGKQLVSINGKLNAKGSRRGPMLDVEVRIEKGLLVRLPSTSGVQLHDSGPLDDVVFTDAAGAAQEAARQELKNAAAPMMRLRIVSDDLIAVRGEELRLDLKVKLTMTQVGGVNVLDGNIEGVRGWIEIVSRRYEIERAWVLFAGEVPLDPRLDVRVSHQFPDTLVYIDVQGRMSEPQVSFASDSGRYDQAQLLGFILGGEGGGGTGSLSESTPGAAANVVANQVAGVIRQAGLPVDALRVGTEEGDAQSRYVTVGKWLTDRLFIAYRYRDTTDIMKNRNEATVQHFFSKDWMWEGVAGDRGAASIDLLWIVPLGR